MSYVSRKDMNQSQASYVRYSDNRDYSKVVLFVATIIMVLVIVLVTGIIKVKAMGDKPLHYSVYGCVPYTHAMVTGHQASGLTHSQCNDKDTTRKGKENNTPVVKTKSPIVMPVNSVQDESPAVVPADTTNDKPAKDSKDGKGNNGHGNNEDKIDSSNPGDGPKNDPAVDPSSPVDDEKKDKSQSSMIGFALLAIIRALQTIKFHVKGLGCMAIFLFGMFGPLAIVVTAIVILIGVSL